MWYAEEILSLHQRAKITSNISLTSRLRITAVVMKLNAVVKLIRMSRLNGREDTAETDEDLQTTTAKDKKKSDADSESKFEICLQLARSPLEENGW